MPALMLRSYISHVGCLLNDLHFLWSPRSLVDIAHGRWGWVRKKGVVARETVLVVFSVVAIILCVCGVSGLWYREMQTSAVDCADRD